MYYLNCDIELNPGFKSQVFREACQYVIGISTV